MSSRSIAWSQGKRYLCIYLLTKQKCLYIHVHDTVLAYSDFFASLKLLDGPGLRGKWLCWGVPGVISFGFDDIGRGKRDGVWETRGLYGGGALMEGERAAGDGGTGETGPNEDRVTEGGGPN